jgi:hypothetical protein
MLTEQKITDKHEKNANELAPVGVVASRTLACDSVPNARTLLAIVLEGVSSKWDKNVLQVLAAPTSVRITVDGYGAIEPTSFLISQTQARHLATQITELLGPE